MPWQSRSRWPSSCSADVAVTTVPVLCGRVVCVAVTVAVVSSSRRRGGLVVVAFVGCSFAGCVSSAWRSPSAAYHDARDDGRSERMTPYASPTPQPRNSERTEQQHDGPTLACAAARASRPRRRRERRRRLNGGRAHVGLARIAGVRRRHAARSDTSRSARRFGGGPGGYTDGGTRRFGSVMKPADRVIDVVRSAVMRARRGAYGRSATATSATFWNRFVRSFSRHLSITASSPGGASGRNIAELAVRHLEDVRDELREVLRLVEDRQPGQELEQARRRATRRPRGDRPCASSAAARATCNTASP